MLLTEIISFSASVVPGGGSGEGIRKMNKEHEWYEVWIDVFYKGEKVGCKEGARTPSFPRRKVTGTGPRRYSSRRWKMKPQLSYGPVADSQIGR